MATTASDRLDPYARALRRRRPAAAAPARAPSGARPACFTAAAMVDLALALVCGVFVAGLCLAGAADVDVGRLGRKAALLLVSLGALFGKAGLGLLEGQAWARWTHAGGVAIVAVAVAVAVPNAAGWLCAAVVGGALGLLPFLASSSGTQRPPGPR